MSDAAAVRARAPCVRAGAAMEPGRATATACIRRLVEILNLGSRLTFLAFRRLGILEKNEGCSLIK